MNVNHVQRQPLQRQVLRGRSRKRKVMQPSPDHHTQTPASVDNADVHSNQSPVAADSTAIHPVDRLTSDRSLAACDKRIDRTPASTKQTGDPQDVKLT
jgi:hypothetical protein